MSEIAELEYVQKLYKEYLCAGLNPTYAWQKALENAYV